MKRNKRPKSSRVEHTHKPAPPPPPFDISAELRALAHDVRQRPRQWRSGLKTKKKCVFLFLFFCSAPDRQISRSSRSRSPPVRLGLLLFWVCGSGPMPNGAKWKVPPHHTTSRDSRLKKAKGVSYFLFRSHTSISSSSSFFLFKKKKKIRSFQWIQVMMEAGRRFTGGALCEEISWAWAKGETLFYSDSQHFCLYFYFKWRREREANKNGSNSTQ